MDALASADLRTMRWRAMKAFIAPPQVGRFKFKFNEEGMRNLNLVSTAPQNLVERLAACSSHSASDARY